MQKNLRYSITLNDAQLDYLSDEQQEIHRMKCFKTFLQMTIPEENKVYGKNFSAVLQPGQFVASKVDLAKLGAATGKRQPVSFKNSINLVFSALNHLIGPLSTR